MTPELAAAIARVIASSADAVLRQRGLAHDLSLSREIGNNAAQTVVMLLDAELDPRCPRCEGMLGSHPVNGQCRPCHDREIRREKDVERAR